MSANRTYSRHCTKCNEETVYVSVYPRSLQIAIRIQQIIISLISFGMVYPQTFSSDDALTVKCTKCGTRGTTSYDRALSR